MALKAVPKSKLKQRRRRRQEVIIEKKMKKLQGLVDPGRAGLNPDQLFLQTAHHILQLRLQVRVLQVLAKIYKP